MRSGVVYFVIIHHQFVLVHFILWYTITNVFWCSLFYAILPPMCFALVYFMMFSVHIMQYQMSEESVRGLIVVP